MKPSLETCYKGLVYNKPYVLHFFLAGHFLGNHSIIDIMRREGFAVHHMRPDESLPKYEVYLK